MAEGSKSDGGVSDVGRVGQVHFQDADVADDGRGDGGDEEEDGGDEEEGYADEVDDSGHDGGGGGFEEGNEQSEGVDGGVRAMHEEGRRGRRREEYCVLIIE